MGLVMTDSIAAKIEVRTLTQYEPEVAAELGRLMLDLNDKASGEPIPEERLRAIIESPNHDQFVAELGGRIVGAAVLSHIYGTLGDKAYLENFVTSREVRGKGVGDRLWFAMKEWCMDRDLMVMDFMSGYTSQEAHRFYHAHGATVRDIIPFRVTFTKDE